jgi:hypothetical protein
VLWGLLAQRLASASLQAAARSLAAPFGLETFYHVLARLRRRLDVVRGCLCRRRKAPESAQADPLLQTVEHLQGVFAGTACPVIEFQLFFQQPLLG